MAGTEKTQSPFERRQAAGACSRVLRKDDEGMKGFESLASYNNLVSSSYLVTVVSQSSH